MHLGFLPSLVRGVHKDVQEWQGGKRGGWYRFCLKITLAFSGQVASAPPVPLPKPYSFCGGRKWETGVYQQSLLPKMPDGSVFPSLW